MQLPKTISLESASRQNQGESRPPLRLMIKATAASQDGPIKASSSLNNQWWRIEGCEPG
jgi:hypothetical protein